MAEFFLPETAEDLAKIDGLSRLFDGYVSADDRRIAELEARVAALENALGLSDRARRLDALGLQIATKVPK